MSSLQFPPSSPVLDGPDQYSDPFKGKERARGRVEYPTPNPSSTLGRSSSPARHDNFGTVEKEAGNFETSEKVEDLEKTQSNFTDNASERTLPKMVQFSKPAQTHHQASDGPETLQNIAARSHVDKNFNIVNPHASVLRVPLLPNRTSLTIGRSSQSCDFHFKIAGQKLDKRISRCHVKIEYNADTLVVTCLGFNGLGMIVPRVCLVKKTGDSKFALCETKTPIFSENVSKSIRLDHEHTEFYVSRGESVEMPRFENVLLQIGGHVILVNPADDDATDDEEGVAEVIFEKSRAQSVKSADARTSTPLKVANNASIAGLLPKSVITPTVAQTADPHTPQKAVRSFECEEPTPSKPFKVAENKENSNAPGHLVRKSATPLSARSVNLPNSLPSSLLKRRAQSEEPQGCVKKGKRTQEYDSNGELIINEQCLGEIANLGEIENILVNHLAFSRLSSTPASFLNTISAVVSKISLEQLRAVLYKTNCIGVIYRQGKDAAGKPLEEEYYYVPEKDRDPERNRLVSAVKGHGGLRACRKTHKQYYWKKPAPIKK